MTIDTFCFIYELLNDSNPHVQIDELVVQALEQKVRNKKEIESFAHLLNNMQTSLKVHIANIFSTHCVSF